MHVLKRIAPSFLGFGNELSDIAIEMVLCGHWRTRSPYFSAIGVNFLMNNSNNLYRYKNSTRISLTLLGNINGARTFLSFNNSLYFVLPIDSSVINKSVIGALDALPANHRAAV